MVSRHVVTLANSIVGVSVLAMPFCFKQCGIMLATLSLMVGAVMTRMVCYFLLKAAVMSRRRTYEMLAWSTFGQTGKFMVEISIIGFLFGTLIAFMVVIGDLGPEILSEMFAVENNSSLRTIIMTALSLFVALPLGLLRNIDSLSSVSTASVLFYLFLVVKIFSDGFGPFWSGEYLERIHFWRSGGLLQCIPIFSMALSCQTQVFGIYDALPEPSLQKMNDIVKQAVYICTFFYFCVGFFGYIAFSQQNFGGNILLSFAPAWSTQLIKSMFLMSVVFSVPLVVFPCRASLHSLMFRSASSYHHVHDISTNYIPDSRMKLLTVTIVGFTLVIGILIPNIELVLGLVGSTTGSVICIIFPSIMFVRVTSKSTTEKLLAQFMFVFGVVLMLLTTYATLYAAEQTQISEHIPDQFRVTDDLLHVKANLRQENVQLNSPISKLDDSKLSQIHGVEFEKKAPDKITPKDSGREKAEVSSPKVSVVRKESERPKANVQSNPSQAPQFKIDTRQLPPVKDIQDNSNKVEVKQVAEQENKKQEVVENPIIESRQLKPENSNPVKPSAEPISQQKPVDNKVASKDNVQPPPQQNVPSENQPPVPVQVPVDDTKKEFVDKQVAEEFLKRLEVHQENQKKLLKEQKEILEELKQHHAQDVHEKIEKERQKDTESNVESPTKDDDAAKKIPNVGSKSLAQPSSDAAAEKIIQGQEKIIEKISENLAKENKNAQMLEKLEENLEGKLIDSQVKAVNQANLPKQNIPPGTEEKVKVSEDKQRDNLPLKKDEVNVNSINVNQNQQNQDNYHQPPKENLSGAMKSVDKERGVLVGSLSVGAKVNDPPKTNVENSQNQPPPLPPSPSGFKEEVPNQMQNVERAALPQSDAHQPASQKISDHSNSNKIGNAIKENDKESEIKSEIKNDVAPVPAVPVPQVNAPSPPSPSKKIESEKEKTSPKEKEKVDREI